MFPNVLFIKVHLRVDGYFVVLLEDFCRRPFRILDPPPAIFFTLRPNVDVACTIADPFAERLAIQVEFVCAYSKGHPDAQMTELPR